MEYFAINGREIVVLLHRVYWKPRSIDKSDLSKLINLSFLEFKKIFER